ncbi:nucleotidyltransferase domain-containing protein [Candidatus Woesearchaeota archaeon]|nr:nucleotidyltransferase domain-containing protein [Candidatus Woesearchaeota archaeon]
MNYKLIAYAQDCVSFLMQNLNHEAGKIIQIILFGSVSRGEESKNSDIDLFVDVTDEIIEPKVVGVVDKFYDSTKFKKYWSLLGVRNKISCTVGKLEEWDELKRSLIANGIVLFGKYSGEIKTKPYYLFVVSPGKSRNKNLSVWRELYGYVQKRGKKKYSKIGLVREYQGRKLGKSVFIVPAEHLPKIRSFLIKNKFKHELMPFWQED